MKSFSSTHSLFLFGRRSATLLVVGVVAAMLFTYTTVVAAPITVGNLVVTRAVGGTADTMGGGGSTGAITTPSALQGSGAAATVFLDEYTTAGVLVQSIQLPNVKQTNGTGTFALTFSGTQNNDGAITLSQNGQYLAVAGYNQSAGPNTLGGTNAIKSGDVDAGGQLTHVPTTGGPPPVAPVQRVVGIIGLDGSVDTTTGLLDVASAQPVRSAYTTNGTDIWVGGSSGGNIATTPTATLTNGVHYTTKGSTTSTALTAGDTNQRILNGFNGQLYMSSRSSGATVRGVSTVGTGFPTSGGPTVPLTQLPGFNAVTAPTPASETADDYWFADANTLYIADQRNTGQSGTPPVAPVPTEGGVQKWIFTDTNADTVADAWVFQYVARLGLSESLAGSDIFLRTVGAHGLTGIKNPYNGVTTLFATTFDNSGALATRLVKLVDDGIAANFQGSLTVLATSPANGGFATAFRGVELIPYVVPEPACLPVIALMILMGIRWRRS